MHELQGRLLRAADAPEGRMARRRTKERSLKLKSETAKLVSSHLRKREQ